MSDLSEIEWNTLRLLRSTADAITADERELILNNGVFPECNHNAKKRSKWTDTVINLVDKGVVKGSSFSVSREPGENGEMQTVSMRGAVTYSPFGYMVAALAKARGQS